MPHNRAKREQEIRNQFNFVVFADTELSLFTAALAVVDIIATGGTYTLEYIKSELGDFGIKVATKMVEAGVNPTVEPIYGDVMTFQNWEQPVPGVKFPLPNKFVPYIAARKKPITTPAAVGAFMVPILQVGTALHETNGYFDFGVARWSGVKPSLFAIKKRETGTGTTEVHILSGDSNFGQFILQTGTALHETDENWRFLLTNWNGGRPDLVAISRRGTSPPYKTEVHILSGESNYQQFVLQVKTALHQTDDTFDFAMAKLSGAKPDLFAIKKSGTGTGKTEVHVMSGESNFSQFILQTGTALHETDETFNFAMGTWSGAKPDLFAIKKSGTGTGKTEVHVMSGESNFSQFILQTGTALHPTDGSFDFQMVNWDLDRPDLMAIKKLATGTRMTEVHIFKG